MCRNGTVSNAAFFCLTGCREFGIIAVKMPKRKQKTYPSVAAFAADKGLKGIELARLLEVHPSQASKLVNGKKYRSLVEPLRIAKRCQMPIEALAPKSAA